MTRNFILLIALSLAGPGTAGEPTPAPSQRFALPLSDQTTTQAVFLSAPNKCLHLVYATQSGKLVFWHLSQTEPDPGPLPPIPPPPVKSLRIAVVHDPTKSTAQERQVMADTAWRATLPPPHEFSGIIPAGLVDPNTKTMPAAQAPFLQAAKGHALPCLVLLNESDAVVTVIDLPGSAAAILKLVRKHGGSQNATPRNRRRKLPTSSRGTTRPSRQDPDTKRARVFASAN